MTGYAAIAIVIDIDMTGYAAIAIGIGIGISIGIIIKEKPMIIIGFLSISQVFFRMRMLPSIINRIYIYL